MIALPETTPGWLREMHDRMTRRLTPEKCDAYVRHWAKKGWLGDEGINIPGLNRQAKAGAAADNGRENPYGPNDRDRPCWARWMFLREQTCDTCSFTGTVKQIHYCPLKGECFEGLGGFRAPSEIQSCRQCDWYEPAEE